MVKRARRRRNVSAVSERARRELGAWPSANGLVEQIVEALSRAAENEPEPERTGRLARRQTCSEAWRVTSP